MTGGNNRPCSTRRSGDPAGIIQLSLITIATASLMMICTQGDNDKEDDNVVDGATTTRSVAPVGDERDLKHATSSFATFVHLLKGNIGPGILNMPEAFMHAGLYVGLIGIPVIGAICIHCMQLLVGDWLHLHSLHAAAGG
ncbi:hypothetical protein HAZT_HAZT008752 [Hyalella azteca]|uniref:Amino acid transporter transmembrane domain-containing protein n=1 Tax=Hyalella azteca TaxID=294128 RepID=A0A6A0GQ97_HYAAZ|nr:hypothetical protein HAZT_HAZT008752 [Hyalella azteca]